MSAADALRVSAVRGSRHICPGKLKCLLSHPASGDPDVKYPEKMESSAGRNSYPGGISYTCEPQRGPSTCVRCRDPSDSTPSGFPKRIRTAMLFGTCEHHTSDDSISYPDMLSGSLTTVSKPCYSPRSAALQWCVCLDIFAMDSKELPSISDCFGDQKVIKTPKLNTI